MENYLRFKLMGGRLKCNKDAVPRFFDCQPKRTAMQKPTPRAAVEKRKAATIVSELLQLASGIMEVSASTSTPETFAEDTVHLGDMDQPSADLQDGTLPNTCDIGVQVRPHYRSKATMCYPSQLGGTCNILTSPIKIAKCDVNLSPIKAPHGGIKRKLLLQVEDIYTSDSSFTASSIVSSSTTGDSVYSCENEGNYTNSVIEQSMKLNALNYVRFISRKHPMMYLGIPDDSTYIIKALSDNIVHHGSCLTSEDVVMIVLRKIRLNESFTIIGNSFGVSPSHVSKLFAKYTPMIANCLKQLIVWPKKESINRLMPTSFQARYSNVESIIDCFEIEIEKPTKAVHQSLTWSEYKKCNTLKYLVSCTPDGIVNFMSKGYGGRVSDMNLLHDSGYLDQLPPGIEVMADRGFKNVELAIQAKKCKLVRPPSISSDEKMSAADCKATKRIASLRIHVERLIRRIREFKFLEPHACIDIHLLGKVDSSVLIAAGLINWQASLIK